MNGTKNCEKGGWDILAKYYCKNRLYKYLKKDLFSYGNMSDKNVRVAVIGGGIHGIASAIALAGEGANVTVVEKKSKLFSGTSGSTQNRAHLGYHYPRSIETARECRDGLKVFETRYPGGIVYPDSAYYLIEAESSRTSGEEFKDFCDILGLPYKMEMPANGFVNRSSVEASFRVPEPVFDLSTLSYLLRKEALSLGINLQMNSEVIGADRIRGGYEITTIGENGRRTLDADIVLNATYSYANNIMNVFGLGEDMTRYRLQKTEVVVMESDYNVPALTIMDGNYVSILPFGRTQDLVLLYDVTHSVIDEKDGFLLDDTPDGLTNLEKMVQHSRKYFPFIDRLRPVCSLYGARPIPVKATGDSRKTRIISHNKAPGVFSILEGKFISAPLVADELVRKMRDEGVL